MSFTHPPAKLAVLVSGRGSNLDAIRQRIEDGSLNAKIQLVISDQEKAPALIKALDAGIQAMWIPYDRTVRRAFEDQAAELIKTADCDLVILGGFMRILTKVFIDHFPDRILNIHPSLLPSFKGMGAQGQAIAYGVKVSGCTVHLVNEQMDAGRILAQRAVAVENGDTEETLAARILAHEHELFPETIGSYWASLNQK